VGCPGLLPTRALKAEAAERAFELGHMCPDAFEVLTGEREEAHRRARHDGGGALSRQEERDLAERVSRPEGLGHLVTAGQDIRVSLFDEVDAGSVAVERDDCGTCLDLDLAHRGRELVELPCREIGEERKCCDPTRIHDHGSCHREKSPAFSLRRLPAVARFSEPTPSASVLQASGFRSDATLFRLNATAESQSGYELAFRRNTANGCTPGTLRVPIEQTYRLEQAGEALQSLPTTYTQGKLSLTIA